MKTSILSTAPLAALVAASAVPDTTNNATLHSFEKRIFSCPFQCDLLKGWCMAGKSIKGVFAGIGGKNNIELPSKTCRCQRIKDEKRCASKCGWNC